MLNRRGLKPGIRWPLTLACLSAGPLLALSAGAVQTLPIHWQAGGQSAGSNSAGQAARVATDAFGNVAVVSGPSMATRLAVTSYTQAGAFRWRGEISPSSGTFAGDWVAAAPNGDFVAVGHNVNSSGASIAITLVRFGSDGAFQWRVDVAGTSFPSVGRLLVDSGGNAYLAFSSGSLGRDIVLQKYSPSGGLLWTQVIDTGFLSNNIATSLVLSADETEVAVVGDTSGGSEWITALYDTATGVRKWLVVAPEGIAALDVVMDAQRVYVTGQGSVGIVGFLTVVAYDRADGTRLWRTDTKPAGSGSAAGLRMAMAPDGSLVATGQTSLGFLDWYTVAFETTGAVRWEAVRDGGLNTDEIPVAVLVLPDGTSVVTGRGGPTLPGGFWGGVTAGYSPAGTLLWEAFSPLVTVWVTALPTGDVVATGGYDAYLAAFRPPAGVGTTYCTAGTSASGCQALLAVSGVPSATAASGFVLSAANVEGHKDGLFFFGTSGRQASSWGNGTSYQCVVPPLTRAQLLTGSGSSGACDGAFAQDLNAFWTAKPAKNPGVGATVQAQLWYRDPLSTSNQPTSLSDAVEFVVGL